MNSDRLGWSQDEREDEARYVWAQGKCNIRSAAYRVSELARDGRPITEADARKIHFNLDLDPVTYNEIACHLKP